MPSAFKHSIVSEIDYLAAEQNSPNKHEFVSGSVFAMTGASIRHNQIALNLAVALRAHSPSACRVSISDVKFKAHQLYYYPDVMVVCEPKSDDYCESQPCLVIEVLSESTERIDRGEKLHNYQKVPQLDTYLLVSQQERRVDVYRRSGEFWRFESAIGDRHIELNSPKMALSLDAIYQGVEFDVDGAKR
jgi:Uma2 family endonuclease